MTSVLPAITLQTGPAPLYSIIWLHGLGADGGDFVPIAEEMQLPAAVRYVFPHAPMRPVTINGGFVMRAWYDILAGADSAEISDNIGRMEDAAGIRASQAEIEKLIAQEKQRGIEAEHIFLAGFSQGGAMALYSGLRHAERLGGIIALSGYLPLAGTTAAEMNAAATGIPVFMAHGRYDPVVPFSLGKDSREKLRQLGHAPEWREYAMQHSVCQEEMDDIESWLTQRMKG